MKGRCHKIVYIKRLKDKKERRNRVKKSTEGEIKSAKERGENWRSEGITLQMRKKPRKSTREEKTEKCIIEKETTAD